MSVSPRMISHESLSASIVLTPPAAATLAAHLAAMLARMTRASLVELAGEDFIRTARAKGLSPVAVLWRHALRNAVLPVVTVAGVQLGARPSRRLAHLIRPASR